MHKNVILRGTDLQFLEPVKYRLAPCLAAVKRSGISKPTDLLLKPAFLDFYGNVLQNVK